MTNSEKGVMERGSILKRYKTIRDRYKTLNEQLKYCLLLPKAKSGEKQALAVYFDTFYGATLDFKEACIKFPFSSIQEKTKDGENTFLEIPSFIAARDELRKLVHDKDIAESLGLNMQYFVAEKPSKSRKKKEQITQDTGAKNELQGTDGDS